jgi:hypothetical protein
MIEKDGGPAFPLPNPRDHTDYLGLLIPSFAGMTLRDWFAGQALAGIAVTSATDEDMPTAQDYAEVAYSMADAMLAERVKVKP